MPAEAERVPAEFVLAVPYRLMQLTHNEKLQNVSSLYIWYYLFFWFYCQGWYALPCPLWQKYKTIYFCLGIFFLLFQKYFLLFKFKHSLPTLGRFQRLWNRIWLTVYTPDIYYPWCSLLQRQLTGMYPFWSWSPLQCWEQRKGWGGGLTLRWQWGGRGAIYPLSKAHIQF